METTVIGAYGREYRTAKAIREDWERGCDFLIQDPGSPLNGHHVSKDDAVPGEILHVRYAGGTRTCVIKAPGRIPGDEESEAGKGHRTRSATKRRTAKAPATPSPDDGRFYLSHQTYGLDLYHRRLRLTYYAPSAEATGAMIQHVDRYPKDLMEISKKRYRKLLDRIMTAWQEALETGGKAKWPTVG